MTCCDGNTELLRHSVPKYDTLCIFILNIKGANKYLNEDIITRKGMVLNDILYLKSNKYHLMVSDNWQALVCKTRNDMTRLKVKRLGFCLTSSSWSNHYLTKIGFQVKTIDDTIASFEIRDSNH